MDVGSKLCVVAHLLILYVQRIQNVLRAKKVERVVDRRAGKGRIAAYKSLVDRFCGWVNFVFCYVL